MNVEKVLAKISQATKVNHGDKSSFVRSHVRLPRYMQRKLKTLSADLQELGCPCYDASNCSLVLIDLTDFFKNIEE